jgi:hypothetical protein
MHEECPVCHQRFKLEIGFFLDYGMINCMITFSFSFVTFIVFLDCLRISIRKQEYLLLGDA